MKTEQPLSTQERNDLVEAFREARKGLVQYRRILLSHGDDEVAPADFHFKWSEDLLHGSENEAKEGFRESAKTQYVIRSFCLYSLTFPDPKRDYIVIIKKNATLVRNKLREIEKEYETNQAISGNCKIVKEQSGDRFSVDVYDENGEIHNILIEAYGKGEAIRGLSSIDRRPKIVIIDDPQDVKDAKSETIQANDWDWFLSDVKFLGQHTRIFFIANNLGEKCIIERVFANAKELGFKTERIPTIVTDQNEVEHSAWPAKYTMEEINRKKESYRKIGKEDIWLREKMCQATSEETRVFKKADRRYYTASLANKISQGCNIAFTLDPASSKDKAACFRAIVINAIDPRNYWYILDVLYGRWDSDELLTHLFNAVKIWRPNLGVGIEKGMFKQIIEPFIYKKMTSDNTFFEIKPIEHAKAGTKLERVKMLSPRFKAHTIWFPDQADWLAEMETELSGVTKDGFKSLFVDLIDTLAMQEQIAEVPYNQMDQGPLPREAMADNTAELVTGTGPGSPQLPRYAHTD